MRIKSRKGILLTLVTIVLFVLMLAELITYVVININYSNLGTAASVTLSTGAFSQSLGSGTSSFLHDSLRRALDALIYYEGNATLRKGNFVNNTALELESLMNNGTIYGSGVMKGYMNGYTLANFTKSLVLKAANQNMGLSINNASLSVYQDSPFALNVSYTALAVLNSTEGTITYPIHAKGSISLNGTMDLYSVESENPQQINVMNNSLVTIVGNARAVSGSKSTFMFVYGTLLVEPSGIVCSSIPAQYRNINYILATSNAANVNQSVCNMGGLVTNVTNSSTPLKPYLVYSNSANIFNYLQNGTKVLLSGSSLALLNISGLKTAYDNNYYYSSLSSPSYLDSSGSALNKNSHSGIFSLDSVNKAVLTTDGGAGMYALIPKPGFNYTETFWFKIPASPTSWQPLTDIYNASVNGGAGGGQNYDFGGTFIESSPQNSFCLLMENWPNSVELSICSPAFMIAPNEWYFASINGNWTTENIYINGQLVASGSMSVSAITNATATLKKPALALFTNPPGGLEEAAAGTSIADVQLFNKSLSRAQINALYHEGINDAPPSSNSLIGWWPLNGNTNDYSGNNNSVISVGPVFFSSLNNYVGNPLKYGAISNPYEYITVAGFGCNNVDSCNSSSLSMPSSAYVLPITLKNSQSTAAPAPFQQMITFNPSAYSAYEASNLGNIRFYQNGTELYSWCESGCSTASSNAIFWVRLPNGIPANSNITISMVFGATSANYDGVYAGEAPQLSPTYGEYDNGQNVFNFYDNFAGTNLNTSKWINGGTGTNCGGAVVSGGGPGVTIDNGFSISTDSSTNWAGVVSSIGFTPPIIFETDTASVSGVASGIAEATSNNLGAGMYFFNFWASGFAEGTIDDGLGNLASPLISPGITGIAWISSSSEMVYHNYIATQETQTAYSLPSEVYPIIGIGDCSSSSSISVQWARTRAYPPNGEMPSMTFGEITPYSYSSSQNALGSINGALLPDAAIFNGDGSASVANSGIINSPSGAITMAGWFNVASFATDTSYPSPLDKEGQYGIYLHPTGVECDISPAWNGNTGSATISTNVWYFFTCTYNGNSKIIYLDGKQIGNFSATGTITPNSNNLGIGVGGNFNYAQYGMNGKEADIYIYNVSLSPAQVQDLYLNNSVPGVTPMAYWPLNGGTAGLMNVTPNLVSGSSYGQLYSGSTICTNADVINGACGVNYATLSGN